jgi:hypothetical protein
MNVKRILKVTAAAMTLCLATVSPCYAARIYNELNFPIDVRGSTLGVFNTSVSVDPGQKSDSLDWADTTVSAYSKKGDKLCVLGFGTHYEIQGGNYMVVSASGNAIACVVCDSNHKPIVGAGDC